jgi:hypothetical protein
MAGGSFELQIREWAAKAGENADMVVRQVALEAWSRIISRSTPVVDTGRFRANWQYGFDTAPTAPLEVNGTSEAPAPAADAPAIAPGMGAGHVHYIVNNVPYARRLEYGHSTKGEGMVRTTVADFAGIVDGAVAEVQGR